MKNNKRLSIQTALRMRRKIRIRKKMLGTYLFPRITIFKSIKSVNVQAINDYKNSTIVSLGSYSKNIKYFMRFKKKMNQSYLIGKYFGRILYRKGVKTIIIDRNGFSYTGRLKLLVDGIKLSGLYI